MLLQTTYVAFIVAAAVVFFARRNTRKLPPGPPAMPVIGHIHLIPPAGQDLFFYELGKRYGDVVHLKILNRYMIILNSAQVAVDLLEKRANIYRDRIYLPIWELLGMGGLISFLKGDDKNYRLQRKMFEQYFSKAKSREYRDIQLREARVLAQNLLAKPETDFIPLTLQFSTSLITEIVYGYRPQVSNDPFLQIIDDCSRAAVESGPMGGTPIDLFPILRYFPAWFPGTYYATYARKASRHFKRLIEFPYEHVKSQMAAGRAKPSFMGSQLEAFKADGQDDGSHVEQLKFAASAAYSAGAETTSSTLSFFLLAMVLYPDCQTRAQEEIEAVIGSARLPDFADRDNLPYLECILQETVRWNHAAPTGIPRKNVEDDVYNGMFIPKGSTIITNFRAMTLDASIYKNPTTFDPSRFLPSPLGRGEPHSSTLFGFGRRKCPGRHLAEDSLWIAIATILATVSIKRAIDGDGKEIIPDAVPTSSGVTR
ncbi:O-methylsterigmatocystin oxidoreductase [Termitomyces sp. J132]|nr:O-methylsterigmatocystin oxidoreductase [Termitomyces sp. J132]